MLCPLQVESNQLYVVRLFEGAREMIPQNERQTPVKELSWMDRMQLKLESLCETEVARNPNHLVQETSAYFEKQMTTVGTNMRKFCAEFVKEMLLPDSPTKLEGSQVDTLQAELRQNNGLLSDTDKFKSAKSAKLIDAPVFNAEASISGSALEDEHELLDHNADVQHDQEASREDLPSMESTTPATLENSTVLPTVSEYSLQQTLPEGADDQYAHWFVSEEYRAMRLGKSTSASSLQSIDGMERTQSSGSLLDWELI